MEKERIKTIATVASIVFGLFGIFVGASKFYAESAQLEAHIVYLGWSSPSGEEVLEALENIESERGRATAGLIRDLKELAVMVSDWSIPESTGPGDIDVTLFRSRIQEAITRLQNNNQYDPGEIELEQDAHGKYLTWPRGERFYLLDEKAQAIDKELIDEALAGALSDERERELKGEALPILRGTDSPEHDRDEQLAIRDLRRLRQQVEQVTNAKLRSVAATVSVLNRSRLPNHILRDAVLVAHVPSGSPISVPLEIRGSGSIESLAAATVRFESDSLGELGKDPERLMEGMKCAIAFRDVQKNDWTAVGGFAIRILPAVQNELEKVAAEAL